MRAIQPIRNTAKSPTHKYGLANGVILHPFVRLMQSRIVSKKDICEVSPLKVLITGEHIATVSPRFA